MVEISWKLHFLVYAGKFLKTICCEIEVDTSSFLMGVIMAQYYGITLQFQGNGTWSSVEHPGSADLSRTKQSEVREAIGRVSREMGMRNPRWCQSKSMAGKRNSVKVNQKALA